MNQNAVAQIAVTITLKALPGKETALAQLLTGAAEIVQQTEPKTLYWFATKVNQNTFTINDGFADESGMQEHFQGKVAAVLKNEAEQLLVGGWEKGVVANIQRSSILSTIQKK